MSAVLHGNLKDFGIADVFQLIGQQRKTGLLEVQNEEGGIEIGFKKGLIISAAPKREIPFLALGESLVGRGLLSCSEFESSVSQSRSSACPLPALWLQCTGVDQDVLDQMNEKVRQDSLFNVMRWSSGTFHFSPLTLRDSDLTGSPLGVEQALMEGLRTLDEWRTFPVEVRRPESRFRLTNATVVGDPDSETTVEGLQIKQILDLLDGVRCVEQVAGRSGLTQFEVARGLTELFRGGRVERVELADLETRQASGSSRSPILSALRTSGAAIFPVLVLVLVVWLSFVWNAPQIRYDALIDGKSPWAEARWRYSKRRLERVREAHEYSLDHVISQARSQVMPETSLDFGELAPDSSGAYPQTEQKHTSVLAASRR